MYDHIYQLRKSPNILHSIYHINKESQDEDEQGLLKTAMQNAEKDAYRVQDAVEQSQPFIAEAGVIIKPIRYRIYWKAIMLTLNIKPNQILDLFGDYSLLFSRMLT